MEDAEGFVVHGNKKAWRKHVLRAVATGIVGTDLGSLIHLYRLAHVHQHAPLNVAAGIFIAGSLTEWAVLDLFYAGLLVLLTAGQMPLISVNRDGVFVRVLGYRPRRLPWEEIKTIYAANRFSFPLFKWQSLPSVIIVPHHAASLYQHLTPWERRWAFGSANPSVPQRLSWASVSGVLMETTPGEFMRRLNRYYQRYAWRPGLPGEPYPSVAAHTLNPSPAFSASPSTHEANVVQSRNVFQQTRVLDTGQTQRRAFHRTLGHHNAGNRRRMPYNRGAERMSAMLKQESQPETIANAAPLTGDTDQRVTPNELTAAIEAIERRKAEAQKRMAETIPVDQAVRELGIDATPEEVLAEVRAQRAAREGGTPAAPVETPVPPLAVNDKQRFEAFLRQFVKESGLDTLPDEVIARLRARRLARTQGTAVVQPTGANPGFSNKRARRGMGIGLAAFLFFGWSTGWWQHAPTFPAYNVTSVDSKPITKTLAEIPDNHPFTSDTASLQEIAEGKPANSITVIDNEEMDNNHYWTVVRKSGHYYIDAYLPARVSPEALKTAPLEIYNDEGDTPGGDSVKVTVQIDGTKVVTSHDAGENSTITLSNVHLDGSSYDNEKD